jgi:hypothetical protein
MQNLEQKRRRAMLYLIRESCDIVTAAKNSGVAGLLGLKCNDGVIGVMGTISAGIYLYQICG